MTWEEQLFSLFDDLEQQAEGMFQVEREQEITDRGQAEYAQVTLASRLMASVDREVVVEVVGVGSVEGTLQRVSADWCLVSGKGQEWIVRLPAISQLRGASERSISEAAWSPISRLGLSSALRQVAQARQRCLLHLVGGTRHDVRPGRVGADFLEATVGESAAAIFAFNAIAAVQKRD
jgi:hypothetical protein